MGQFKLDVSDGEDVNRGSYIITIKLVNELKLSKLKEYLRGELSYIPRDILQGIDLVLKEILLGFQLAEAFTPHMKKSTSVEELLQIVAFSKV